MRSLFLILTLILATPVAAQGRAPSVTGAWIGNGAENLTVRAKLSVEGGALRLRIWEKTGKGGETLAADVSGILRINGSGKVAKGDLDLAFGQADGKTRLSVASSWRDDALHDGLEAIQIGRANGEYFVVSYSSMYGSEYGVTACGAIFLTGSNNVDGRVNTRKKPTLDALSLTQWRMGRAQQLGFC